MNKSVAMRAQQTVNSRPCEKIKVLLFSVLASLLISGAALAQSAVITYPSAVANTPYADVAKLPSIKPSMKVSYAPLPEHADTLQTDAAQTNTIDEASNQQYALYWAAQTQPDIKEAPPVVVFIHGGCWLSAFDIAHAAPFSTALAQAGFPVWSLEYRRAGNGGEWPIALDDLSLGMQKLSVLADAGVDISRIVLIGHSAGGHLAAMLASKITNNASAVLPQQVNSLELITLAGIIDIEAYAEGSNSCQRATPQFMQGLPSDKPQDYNAANPLMQTISSARITQFVLLQGQQDSIVPPAQAKHKDGTSIIDKEAGHFDWIHPGSHAFSLLLQELR